jgi:hypothetical protein
MPFGTMKFNGGWGLLGDGTWQFGPGVTARRWNQLDVFVVGMDNRVYTKYWSNDHGWSNGWGDLGGDVTSTVAVAGKTDDELDIFARGRDGQLWTKWFKEANGWSGWGL